ncbi:hypothetical protein EVAR_36851_1 [Eumeta japonica]|uniref:Uncharacterized protein n=1 Tax=Eumeta variegata TaxID=151549 RepID=A0A4C1WRF5_EUMVA|nr:hypothetical protein EVAR_36851_1 [Eumeta japonica]
MSSLLLFGLGSGLSGRRWRLRLPVRILSVQAGPRGAAAITHVKCQEADGAAGRRGAARAQYHQRAANKPLRRIYIGPCARCSSSFTDIYCDRWTPPPE